MVAIDQAGVRASDRDRKSNLVGSDLGGSLSIPDITQGA